MSFDDEKDEEEDEKNDIEITKKILNEYAKYDKKYFLVFVNA